MRLLSDKELEQPKDYEIQDEVILDTDEILNSKKFSINMPDDVDLVTKDFDVYPYWMILVGMSFLLGFVLGVYW